MRLLTICTLLTICLTVTGPGCLKKKNGRYPIDTLPATTRPITDGLIYPLSIVNENKYTYPTGKVVIIQNSGPHGGRGFTDSRGIFFGYRVFSTRIINESDTPLILSINFPSDSFPLPEPDSYMKVFFLPDSMIHETWTLDNYDAFLKSYYEAVLHKLARLDTTIKPKEAYLFPIVLLRHNDAGSNPRAGFFLKGERLFYKIATQFDTLIPCGQIVFKK